MAYNRLKPLGSGMPKRDFKCANDGGWQQQLPHWDTIMIHRYRKALARATVRLKQFKIKEAKRIAHDRDRNEGNAARAA